ncbi:MAG: FIST N-terminal domain-containing protein [Paracoccaceae bacterium]
MNHKPFERGANPLATAKRINPVLLTAQVDHDASDPVGALQERLAFETLALLMLFVSPDADFADAVARAEALYPSTDVIACTTAGEIGTGGYKEGTIVAVGFPADHFATHTVLIEDLETIAPQDVIDCVVQQGVAMRASGSDFENAFAFLAVDGLSLKEDILTAAIAAGLGDVPLFGGSAGDGTTFQQTLLALNGSIHRNAAALTLIRSDHEIHVFSLNHLVPTEKQMVVTEADPDRRIVKEINAEPAAREYARIVGKDPEQLDQFTFASHPVAVRIGDTHHVRAIQQVNPDGELVFFSAIDEGMVLTVADPANMAQHLETELERLSATREPGAILGCDCILRRIEAEQKQMTQDVSAVLNRHKVIGFSTYGEQIGPLHVNHTMTGVAIYPNRDKG